MLGTLGSWSWMTKEYMLCSSIHPSIYPYYISSWNTYFYPSLFILFQWALWAFISLFLPLFLSVSCLLYSPPLSFSTPLPPPFFALSSFGLVRFAFPSHPIISFHSFFLLSSLLPFLFNVLLTSYFFLPVSGLIADSLWLRVITFSTDVTSSS